MIVNYIFKILIITLVFNSCQENVVEAIHGCFDSQACNYNPDATYDNNSCKYYDITYDENDESTWETACCRDEEMDECGVCFGNNDDKDCMGICFGDTSFDDCIVCGGDGTYCYPIDLSFGDIYYSENDELIIPIYIDSPQDISGFQFNLTENDIITAASGGLAEEYDFTLNVDPTSEESSNLVLGFSITANQLPSGSNGILTNLTVIPAGSQVCFEPENNFFIKTVNPNSEIDLIHDREDGNEDGVIQYQINLGECKEISTI